jgi:hypothetical protein
MELAVLALLILAFCGPVALLGGSSGREEAAPRQTQSSIVITEKTDGDYLRAGVYLLSLIFAWVSFGWATVLPSLLLISLFGVGGPAEMLALLVLSLPWTGPAGLALMFWTRSGSTFRVAIPVLAACYLVWLVITFPLGILYFPAGVSLMVGALLRTVLPPPAGGEPAPTERRQAAARRGVLIV